jgi:hypothetical protein
MYKHAGRQADRQTTSLYNLEVLKMYFPIKILFYIIPVLHVMPFKVE